MCVLMTSLFAQFWDIKVHYYLIAVHLTDSLRSIGTIFEKYDAVIPYQPMAAHIVTYKADRGASLVSWLTGFSVPQNWNLCLFMTPDKWTWHSSAILSFFRKFSSVSSFSCKFTVQILLSCVAAMVSAHSVTELCRGRHAHRTGGYVARMAPEC